MKIIKNFSHYLSHADLARSLPFSYLRSFSAFPAFFLVGLLFHRCDKVKQRSHQDPDVKSHF